MAQTPSSIKLAGGCDGCAARLRFRYEVWRNLVLERGQGRADRHVHVQVLIGPQPSPEEYVGLVGLSPGQRTIMAEFGTVCRSADRIERLVELARRTRGFSHDNSSIRRIVIPLRIKVPILVNPGVQDVDIGVVYDRRSLEVGNVHHLALEPDRAPTQPASRVVEIAVEWT